MQYHTIIHIDKSSITNHSGHVWSVMLSAGKTQIKTHTGKEHHQSFHELMVDAVLSTSSGTQAEITQIQERSLSTARVRVVDGDPSYDSAQLEIHTYTKTDIAGHPLTSGVAGGVLPDDTTESTHIHKDGPSLTIPGQGMVDGDSHRTSNTYTKDIIDHPPLLQGG